MKIVLIHGQNHKGSTYHMGRMLAGKLTEEWGITEFFLPRDLPHFCLGCYACIEDETKCPYWREKESILRAMERADLFILTSPNYCLAPSGAMKSFLDMLFDCWMVHRPKEWMFTKRAVVFSASAGAPCKKAIQPIKDSLLYWGVPEIHTYGLAVQAMNWETVKPERKAQIEKRIAGIAARIDCKKPPRVGIKTKLLFHFLRMLHQKGWDSSPKERAYWEAQGWLGKDRPWNISKDGKPAMTEPPMDNLPDGEIDWAEIGAFIEDMLDARHNGNKGWWIIKDPAQTENLQKNSVTVLKLLEDDLYGYFYAQHDDRNAVWRRMEQYIRTKYGKLPAKALSRVISVYHIDDR